jgi:hypothetical protein
MIDEVKGTKALSKRAPFKMKLFSTNVFKAYAKRVRECVDNYDDVGEELRRVERPEVSKSCIPITVHAMHISLPKQ